MSSGEPSRELTLTEVIERLPEMHRARDELMLLRARVAELEANDTRHELEMAAQITVNTQLADRVAELEAVLLSNGLVQREEVGELAGMPAVLRGEDE